MTRTIITRRQKRARLRADLATIREAAQCWSPAIERRVLALPRWQFVSAVTDAHIVLEIRRAFERDLKHLLQVYGYQ